MVGDQGLVLLCICDIYNYYKVVILVSAAIAPGSLEVTFFTALAVQNFPVFYCIHLNTVFHENLVKKYSSHA